MTRYAVVALLLAGIGCSTPTIAAPDADVPPTPIDSTVRVRWGGQDEVGDPSDSRVPRTPVGPVKPCPDIVGDPVVSVDIEVVIGQQSAFVADQTVDCALGQIDIPVPAGAGTLRLDVATSLGYSWLSAYAPITTTSGAVTESAIVNLDFELPTSGGGGGGDGGGLGSYF